MNKHVGLTYSMSSEDDCPTYNFFVYDDSDTIYQDLTDEEMQYLSARAQLKKRKKREGLAHMEEYDESDDRGDYEY